MAGVVVFFFFSFYLFGVRKICLWCCLWWWILYILVFGTPFLTAHSYTTFAGEGISFLFCLSFFPDFFVLEGWRMCWADVGWEMGDSVVGGGCLRDRLGLFSSFSS